MIIGCGSLLASSDHLGICIQPDIKCDAGLVHREDDSEATVRGIERA